MLLLASVRPVQAIQAYGSSEPFHAGPVPAQATRAGPVPPTPAQCQRSGSLGEGTDAVICASMQYIPWHFGLLSVVVQVAEEKGDFTTVSANDFSEALLVILVEGQAKVCQLYAPVFVAYNSLAIR